MRAMASLDRGNTEHFGDPEPIKVVTGTVKGPGILVTGHDLLDLDELLKQTDGTGVNVYTHGEMLPAHGYPKLRSYKHLIGNYGGAWQKQRAEFAAFNGPIVATTNCVLLPAESYKDRLFTTGIAAIAGVRHIESRTGFSEVIAKAKELGDLPNDMGEPLMTGFHHKAVLGLADKVIDAVKAGKIKHLLTLGCGKGASEKTRTTRCRT